MPDRAAAPAAGRQDDQAAFDGLTGILRELAEAVAAERGREAGLAAARKLAETYGGRTVKIPQKVTDKAPIAKALGKALAATLVELRSGESVTVPLGIAAAQRRQRAEIVRLLQAGEFSENEIAARLRCHRRTVERVAKALQCKDPRAPSLFDRLPD